MATLVRLIGSAATERHVRTRFVVPDLKVLQFVSHLLAASWDQDDSCAERLHGQDEAFQYRDAAMLAHGSESRLDASPFTPALESVTPELCSLIADQVLAGEIPAN